MSEHLALNYITNCIYSLSFSLESLQIDLYTPSFISCKTNLIELQTLGVWNTPSGYKNIFSLNLLFLLVFGTLHHNLYTILKHLSINDL